MSNIDLFTCRRESEKNWQGKGRKKRNKTKKVEQKSRKKDEQIFSLINLNKHLKFKDY